MGTFGQIFACRQRLERFLCHTAFRDDVIQGGAEFAGIVRDNDLRFRENPLHIAEGGPGADYGGQYLGLFWAGGTAFSSASTCASSQRKRILLPSVEQRRGIISRLGR